MERLRVLVMALQIKPLTRDEMAGVLQMGPSGVRKYLVDLAGKYEWVAGEEQDVCRLTIGEDETAALLANLAAAAPSKSARRTKTALSIAAQDPARHFHILQDDEHYSIRPVRGIPAPAPEMAYFYGMLRSEVRV
jgi:hypothetical protein